MKERREPERFLNSKVLWRALALLLKQSEGHTLSPEF
jgi:hypothetical protein